MRQSNAFPILIFFAILLIGAFLHYGMFGIQASIAGYATLLMTLIIAVVASYAIKVADQWDRAVVLRLGRFHVLRVRRQQP